MNLRQSNPATPGDIAVVLGTRPEIIKLAGVIKELGPRARVVHTGQHWNNAMAGQFFEQLGIGTPNVQLTGMTGRVKGQQIAAGIMDLAHHFSDFPPSVVIVQGDTNSSSAGAQAANQAGVPVVHVEAGLRSYDRAMPEEINRLIVGALSDVHCAATEENASNLRREGVAKERIVVTGNTVVEATLSSLALAGSMTTPTTPTGRYILATVHRPENTDSKEALSRILHSLVSLKRQVVVPAHPRLTAAVDRFELNDLFWQLTIVGSLGHPEFLRLAAGAELIISDSGGLQEETTVLKKPLLVIRNSTERPESIKAGFAVLVRPEMDIADQVNAVLNDPEKLERLRRTPSPYGDGRASERIAEISMGLADQTFMTTSPEEGRR